MNTTTPAIAILGSINWDLVIRAPRLPEPGETILGGPFATHPGGKGANQAVAAARLGARVAMIGCVGNDAAGQQLTAALKREGIDTRFVTRLQDSATGVAAITVDKSGQNTIIVAPGANAQLDSQHVDHARDAIAQAHVLLAQLEIPVDTVAHAMAAARECGTFVILNAAPATDLPLATLEHVDCLIVNETEARTMSGTEDGSRFARGDFEDLAVGLQAMGPGCVVVTRGAKGAVSCTGGQVETHATFSVQAIDATAAGDAFCGALAVAIAEAGPGLDMHRAIRFASAAGALAATKHGAQPSLPKRAVVDATCGG